MKAFYWKLICILLLFITMQILYAQERDCPVTIFYGLNESHGNDWVQQDRNELLGMVLFYQETGNLVYKTINTEGVENETIISNGTHLEVSVLLYDSSNNPHIFVAQSTPIQQTITHYYQTNCANWQNETIYTFQNDGTDFIYEMSADVDSENSFHLAVLKTIDNPDSDNYYNAYLDAQLYYVTNAVTGWNSQLVKQFDMIWTLDEYSKTFNRQDIKVDQNQKVHILYGEQLHESGNLYPNRLNYANNVNGNWQYEVAVNFDQNTCDSAGWYFSLAIDQTNIPCISYCYIRRVGSGSAINARLWFGRRLSSNNWFNEPVCVNDDEYWGYDGHGYTGAHTCLTFDSDNNPFIAFSDIASSHANMNYFNTGNIRVAIKNNNQWSIRTLYHQPRPVSFFNAQEIYGLGLFLTPNHHIKIVAQELSLISEESYSFRIIYFNENPTSSDIPDSNFSFQLNNYPNPFNPITKITFTLSDCSKIKMDIFNTKGQKIKNLCDAFFNSGFHQIEWNGKDDRNYDCPSGIYFCHLKDKNQHYYKKMILLK